MAGQFPLIEGRGKTVVHRDHYRSSGFLWDAAEVRSYRAAVDTTAQHAMDPDQSAETIAAIIKMGDRVTIAIRWRKARTSTETECIELGHTLDVVRDSKNPNGPVLPVAGLKTFLVAVQTGRLVR